MEKIINENSKIEFDEENNILTITNEKNGNTYINKLYVIEKIDEENPEGTSILKYKLHD